jgi:hypothetical protein
LEKKVTHRSREQPPPEAVDIDEWRSGVAAAIRRAAHLSDAAIRALSDQALALLDRHTSWAAAKTAAPSDLQRQHESNALALKKASSVLEDILKSDGGTIRAALDQALLPNSAKRRRRPTIAIDDEGRIVAAQVAQFLRAVANGQELSIAVEHSIPFRTEADWKLWFVLDLLRLWCEHLRIDPAAVTLGSPDTPAPFLQFLISVVMPVDGHRAADGFSASTLRRLAAKALRYPVSGGAAQ